MSDWDAVKPYESENISRVTLRDLVSGGDDFFNFDLSEIQNILKSLEGTVALSLPEVEDLQQRTLRGADILSECLAKLTKTVITLESKANSIKNRVSLEYVNPSSNKTTSEDKKRAGECSPEVEELQIRLAEAKGSKVLIEKKYDILIKAHHHYKDISTGLRRTILNS